MFVNNRKENMKISEYLNRCRDGFKGVNKKNHRRAWELLDLEIRMYSFLLLEKERIEKVMLDLENKVYLNRRLKPVSFYYQRGYDLLEQNRSKVDDVLKVNFMFAYIKFYALLKYCDEKGYQAMDIDDALTYRGILMIDDEEVKEIAKEFDMDEYYEDDYRKKVEVVDKKYMYENIKRVQDENVVQEQLIKAGLWNKKDKLRFDTENSIRMDLLQEALKNAYEPVLLEKGLFLVSSYLEEISMIVKLNPGEDPFKKYKEVKKKVLKMEAPGLILNCDQCANLGDSLYFITRLEYPLLDEYQSPLDFEYLDSLNWKYSRS